MVGGVVGGVVVAILLLLVVCVVIVLVVFVVRERDAYKPENTLSNPMYDGKHHWLRLAKTSDPKIIMHT